MTGPILGIIVSAGAMGFGWMQLKRGHTINGRLALALGLLGLALNLYALFAAR